MKVKKLIEEKQKRLNWLVDQGRFSQAEANQQALQYAMLVCLYYRE